MKKVNGIMITYEEMDWLLRKVTEDGKLVGNEIYTWEDYVGYVIGHKDLIDIPNVKEKMLKHLNISDITGIHFIESDNSYILICNKEKVDL